MKRGMPSGAQTPDGIIFLLALIFSKAPPRYPPHHGAHWAYTDILDYFPAIPASHSSINVLNHIHQQWFGLCRLFLSGYPGHIHWKIVVVQVEAIPTFYA